MNPEMLEVIERVAVRVGQEVAKAVVDALRPPAEDARAQEGQKGPRKVRDRVWEMRYVRMIIGLRDLEEKGEAVNSKTLLRSTGMHWNPIRDTLAILERTGHVRREDGVWSLTEKGRTADLRDPIPQAVGAVEIQ